MPGWQEVLVVLSVAAASAYVGFKLVLEPALRGRRPDVPASRLVRKKRPAPSRGCH